MDAWHRTFDQLRALWRGLAAMQRASLSVIGLGVLAGMGWLIWSSTGPTDEFLLGGKTFTTEELKETQAALKSAGLTQFKTVGQRISVPAREADRYTAAAISRQALPAQFAAEFDRMQSKVNLFTSNEQRRELLEEARKTRLAQILRAIPEIEEAVVEWDRPRSANLFRPAPQLAAHVSVKPRGGRELSPELVQSLKLFVAGALAGAHVDDVTVVDMNTSRVHGRRSPGDVAGEHVLELTKQHETEYSSQMTRALSYIPDVLVTVNVELVAERHPSDLQDSFVNAEIVPVDRRQQNWPASRSRRSNDPSSHRVDAESVVRAVRGVDLDQDLSTTERRVVVDQFDSAEQPTTGYRKSVQVAVSIPENYYAAVARQRGLRPGESLVQDSAFRASLASIKSETQRDVRNKLAHLLPRGSDYSAVSVTTYTPLRALPDKPNSATTTMSELPFEIDLTHWKMGVGIAICSLCLLCLLVRFRPQRAASSMPLPDSTEAANVPNVIPLADAIDEYPDLNPNPHAAVLAELAQLERRTPAAAVQRNTPFAFLTDLSITDAAGLLASEHPQTIALVATALAPVRAAEILHSLPESLRWDVTQRLTRIGPAAPDVLCEVAASLQSRLLSRSTTQSPSLDVAPESPPDKSPAPVVPTALNETAGWPFTFDDLQTLDVRSLARVLESIDLRACAVALLDRSESFKQALLAMMPRQVSKAVRQHLRQLGPVRLIEIAASQQAIAEVAWNLSVQGLIVPVHLEGSHR